jgi:hypothetical protein
MNTANPFEAHYPNLAIWIRDYEGWVEIGQDGISHSLVRVLNPGGMVWESKTSYVSIDEALAEADRVAAAELATY